MLMYLPSSACSALTIMQYVWDGGPSLEEVWQMVLAWRSRGLGWTQLPRCTWLTTGLIWATALWFMSDSGSVVTAGKAMHQWISLSQLSLGKDRGCIRDPCYDRGWIQWQTILVLYILTQPLHISLGFCTYARVHYCTWVVRLLHIRM